MQEGNQRKEFCSNRFSVFVTNGEEVLSGKTVRHTFYPVHATQTAVEFKILSTPNKKPRYSDEADVTVEGRVFIPLPGHGILDRNIEVTVRIQSFNPLLRLPVLHALLVLATGHEIYEITMQCDVPRML